MRSIAGVLLVALQATACSANDGFEAVDSQGSAVTGVSVTRASSSISKTPLQAGQTQTATVTLKSATSLSNLIVDIRLYNSGNQVVSKKTFEPVAISAGGTVTLQFDYQSPTTMPLGSYTFTVGVWDTSWNTLLYETIGSFEVTSAGSSSCSYPNWVEYQFYRAGSIVTYNGQLYIAKYDNPGYIPTVSTYYWAPYVCAGSTPPPTTTNLPAKIVGGYLTTWGYRNGVTLRSVVDNTSYNLIYVAFATGSSASSGTLRLALPPGASSAADFKNQVAYANSKGKKVIVSVGGYYDLGGYASGYRLDSSAKVDQFMTSMRDFRNTWGFNGMDWDLEHGDRPDSAGIVDASRRMKSEFGSSWIIASAPGVNLPSWVGSGGILDTLGPTGWDAVGEQVYDWGISESAYRSLIIERMTVLSNKYGADKVMLGNAYKTDTASSSLADPQNRWVDIGTTKGALTTLRSAGINIRGAFTWTVQADSDTGYLWQAANGVGGDILSHP